MNNVVFRPTNGASDAAGMAAIHLERQEADGLVEGLLFESTASLEQLTRDLESPNFSDWVVAEDEGRVIAYGHTQYDWSEYDDRKCYLHLGWVTPSYRSQGVGTELLRRLEERCREKAEREGFIGRSDLGANASSTETSAVQLLLDSGYEVLYTVMEMRLPDGHSVEVTDLPEGYDLRAVTPDHHLAIWQMVGDAYYDVAESGRGGEIATEGRFKHYFEGDPSLWFVAWRGYRIAGAVLCRITNGTAEVYEVSVGYAHRRKGLARALLTRALGEVAAREPEVVRIVTKKEFPTQAWRLYESVGFQAVKEFPRWRKWM